MRVRSADTKGADTRPARLRAAFPVHGFRDRIKRTVGEVDARVGRGEIPQRRDDAVLELHHGLDQSGRPGGHVKVTDMRLARAERAELLSLGSALAERLGQGGHLDRIAKRCAGSMRLDVGYGRRLDARRSLRHGYHVGLRVHARRGEADFLGAVVVDRPAFDDRQHGVAVGNRLAEPFEQNHADPVAEDGPVGTGIEGTALAVTRYHGVFLVKVVAPLRKTDGRAARQCHVGLVGQQRGTRLADRHQRCRARALHAHARPAQVKLVGHADRQEVLVVAQHGLVFAHLVIARQGSSLVDMV